LGEIEKAHTSISTMTLGTAILTKVSEEVLTSILQSREVSLGKEIWLLPTDSFHLGIFFVITVATSCFSDL